jgi:diacylglycerol kinase
MVPIEYQSADDQTVETPEEEIRRPDRPWGEKFSDAFRGLRQGIRGESSFFAHFFIAAAVALSAVVLDINIIEWCILIICITVVLVAEMVNTALESLARAITDEPNPHVGGALDIGSAAVLLAAIGAAVVGAIVLLGALAKLLGWC